MNLITTAALAATLALSSSAQGVDLPPAQRLLDSISGAFEVPTGEYQRRATDAFLGDVETHMGIARDTMAGAMDDLDIPEPTAYFAVEATPYGRKTLHQSIYFFDSVRFGRFFIQLGAGAGPLAGLWSITPTKTRLGDSRTLLDIHLQGSAFWCDVTFDTAAPLEQMRTTYLCSRGPIGDALFCPAD